MFDDLCALQQALGQCLAVADDAHLHYWYTVLEDTLPAYAPAFTEVQQALGWVEDIETILDIPLTTAEEPGPGGDAVAHRSLIFRAVS